MYTLHHLSEETLTKIDNECTRYMMEYPNQNYGGYLKNIIDILASELDDLPNNGRKLHVQV